MNSWGRVIILGALALPCYSQRDIKAWYTQGQIWVVIDLELSYPIQDQDARVYTLYKSENPFTRADQAEIAARLFVQELVPSALRKQFNQPELTFRIPTPYGGTYQLRANEGLFVLTAHESGSMYVGVTQDGKLAPRNERIISTTHVNYKYNKSEPPQCHLQFTTQIANEYEVAAYYMWADGQQDSRKARADFPVMANIFKNGMPSMFFISQSKTHARQSGQPLIHWLHGENGSASSSLPNRRKSINIAPREGILVAHNDDFYRYVDTTLITHQSHTGFFGWAKQHNPFLRSSATRNPNDTIINYTQRRILWINDWIVNKFNADPNRISIQGHQVGAFGASILSRAYPDQFSSATLFNYGLTYRSNEDPNSQLTNLFGAAGENLPTNLIDADGRTVHTQQLGSSTENIASQRDMCFTQIWHGTNNEEATMSWNPSFLKQVYRSDSLGLGWQFYWDERDHSLETIYSYWIESAQNGQQTQRDDVAFHEQFRNDQSFPAFFNHQLDERNHLPGLNVNSILPTGKNGWGTWGGYHNWDTNSVIDQPQQWSCSMWLTADAPFENDNCPHAALTCDIAIRKPQAFHPVPGSVVEWSLIDESNQEIVEKGRTIVQPNGLVIVKQITLLREDFGKSTLQLRTEDYTTSTKNTIEHHQIEVFPNPTTGPLTLRLPDTRTSQSVIYIVDALGRVQWHRPAMELPTTATIDVSFLSPGTYTTIYQMEDKRSYQKFVRTP